MHISNRFVQEDMIQWESTADLKSKYISYDQKCFLLMHYVSDKICIIAGYKTYNASFCQIRKLAGFIDAIKFANINTNHFLKS